MKAAMAFIAMGRRDLVFLMKVHKSPQKRAKPDYGIGNPRAIRNLFIAGACAIAAGLAVPVFHAGGFRIFLIGPTLLALGSLSLALSASMLAYSLLGKFNVRNRMLKAIAWRGNETVLDIGTGSGLLAIGAAKHLKTGTVAVAGSWDGEDASGCPLEAVQRNAEIEGVQDRLELVSGDPRNIGFVDNSFDAVLCLQGLDSMDAAGLNLACREIARVLKPRGIAVAAGKSQMADCARAFKAAGTHRGRAEIL